MADQVQYHLEKMVPELEDLQERGIFSETEIKAIVKARTAHEYRVHRIIPQKGDFLRYISYEDNLERLRRVRKKRLYGEKPKGDEKGKEGGLSSLSDYSILRRLHGLYSRMLKKFGGDPALWVQYFEWCKRTNSSKALAKNFARAIQLHPTNASFWIMAAAYEFEKNSNMQSARILLQRGLRINSESRKLWLEYFRLELLWIEKLRARRKILLAQGSQVHAEPLAPAPNAEESVTIPALEAENDSNDSPVAEVESKKEINATEQALAEVVIPRIIYRNAIKTIPEDLTVRLEFLKIYRSFDGTQKGCEEVYESLKEDFAREPAAIGALAARHLDGIAVDDPSYPGALKAAVVEFEESVKTSPTPAIWETYHSFLKGQLAAVDDKSLQTYLRKLLKHTLHRAHRTEAATEHMYLCWKDISLDEVGPLFGETLQRIPSAQLWLLFISMQKKADQRSLFEKAVGEVEKSGRCEVWIAYLNWINECGQELSDDDAAKVFLKALHLLPESATSIVTLYHEHLSRRGLSTGDALRKFYSTTVPYSHSSEFYLKCIELESPSRKRSHESSALDLKQLSHLRGLYDLAVRADDRNKIAWLEYCKFEIKIAKDVQKASQVYWRAQKSVKDTDDFEREWQAIKDSL
ncbi:U3 small nucleolar RNA-associated protein 6-domain-containing protein [Gaertneriomyces semiglobifer]|nr:U3 small nucleolar RNA-associated protein 6-domain-containing protein [Gaertneriomyces semiglobifer]